MEKHNRSETEKKKGYISVHSQRLYRVFARTTRVTCSFRRRVSRALLFLRQHPFLSSCRGRCRCGFAPEWAWRLESVFRMSTGGPREFFFVGALDKGQ